MRLVGCHDSLLRLFGPSKISFALLTGDNQFNYLQVDMQLVRLIYRSLLLIFIINNYAKEGVLFKSYIYNDNLKASGSCPSLTTTLPNAFQTVSRLVVVIAVMNAGYRRQSQLFFDGMEGY